MPKTLAIAILPMFALLGSCGGESANDLTTTNTGNIVPSDAQANTSFENDAVLNTQAEDMNAAMEGNVVATDGTYGGMTNATGGDMVGNGM